MKKAENKSPNYRGALEEYKVGLCDMEIALRARDLQSDPEVPHEYCEGGLGGVKKEGKAAGDFV